MDRENDKKHLYHIGFEVSHKVDPRIEMKQPYFHEFYEVYLSQTDHMLMLVNDRLYHVNKNDLLVFNHFDLHNVTLQDNQYYDRIIALFDPEYVQSLSTEQTNLTACFENRTDSFCHVRHLDQEQAQFLSEKLNEIQKIQDSTQYGDDVLKKMLLVHILIFVNRLYSGDAPQMQHAVSPEYQKIGLIVQYINDHLDEDLSLDRLSALFFISKYHLCHTFKLATGHTIHEFITFRKMLKASKMLRCGSTISEICDQLGYQHSCHFITTFKKNVGITPKKYAQKFQDLR